MRLSSGEIEPKFVFQFAMAQRALNGTTSLYKGTKVPRKFQTILAEMVGRVGIEPTTN